MRVCRGSVSGTRGREGGGEAGRLEGFFPQFVSVYSESVVRTFRGSNNLRSCFFPQKNEIIRCIYASIIDHL